MPCHDMNGNHEKHITSKDQKTLTTSLYTLFYWKWCYLSEIIIFTDTYISAILSSKNTEIRLLEEESLWKLTKKKLKYLNWPFQLYI